MAAEKGTTKTQVPADIRWEMLDKSRFFILGAARFSGVSTALYPAVVLKTRVQFARPPVSCGRVAAAILHHEGPVGFDRGLATSLVGTIPARALYMSALELTKSIVVSAATRMAPPSTPRNSVLYFQGELIMDIYKESFAGVDELCFNIQREMSSHSDNKAEQLTSTFGEDIKPLISSERYNFSPSVYSPRIPPSIDGIDPWLNPCTSKLNSTLKTTTSSTILQFQNPANTSNVVQREGGLKLEKETSKYSHAAEWTEKVINKEGLKTTHAQDHIIAERKRREKLSQRFIELSAVIPGLKKMDKASVLSDAIKYVKQLREKVKCLEENKVEPTLLIKRSGIIASTDDNFVSGASSKPAPQLEVKWSGRTILVRIQCEKRKGVLAKVLKEIEDLNVTVISASAIPFTESSLDVTITAQIDGGLDFTANDFVKKLSLGFNQFL